MKICSMDARIEGEDLLITFRREPDAPYRLWKFVMDNLQAIERAAWEMPEERLREAGDDGLPSATRKGRVETHSSLQ